jgi:hypothetical protein
MGGRQPRWQGDAGWQKLWKDSAQNQLERQQGLQLQGLRAVAEAPSAQTVRFWPLTCSFCRHNLLGIGFFPAELYRTTSACSAESLITTTYFEDVVHHPD